MLCVLVLLETNSVFLSENGDKTLKILNPLMLSLDS